MKKHFILFLSLATALLLTSCSGSTDSSVSASSIPESEASQSTSDASTYQEDVSTQTPDKSQNQTSFDTSWAGADYEMPIPAPPFAAEVEFDANRNRFFINSVDADEVKALPLDSIIDYCNTLKALGYNESLQEHELTGGTTRNGYEFYGEDGMGGCVTLFDDSHGCMLMLILPS